MTVRIGSTRQLFLDDAVVDAVENVRRRLHRPVRHAANPVVRADRSWEQGGTGVDLTGGTVLFDGAERCFKMWYRTNQAILERAADGTLREATGAAYMACYAVSRDGVVWEKPALGLADSSGSPENNILPPGCDGRAFIRRPNLVKDYDDPDPERRYKMVYMDEIGDRFGLLAAYSGDGVHWRMEAAAPAFFERPVIPNGILFGWDPRRREYVHYHRSAGLRPADIDGRMVRSDLRRIVRSSSRDFERWGETSTAFELAPEDPDDLDVGHLGILSGVLYTDDLYVGFVDTATARAVEDVPPELWESIYKMDHAEHRQELVISRDGLRWTRVAPHWECLRPGLPGEWDSGHCIPAKPIVVGDRIYVFYSGCRLTCKSYLPGAPDPAAAGYAIGLAVLRLDGFASMEAHARGWLRTRPLVFAGDRLTLNARTAPAGRGDSGPMEVVFEGDRTWMRPRGAPEGSEPRGGLSVEIQDAAGEPLPGFRAEDCDRFASDETRHVVSWRGSADLSRLEGRTVRVEFSLERAALYAFQFTGAGSSRASLDPGCPGCRGLPRQQRRSPERS